MLVRRWRGRSDRQGLECHVVPDWLRAGRHRGHLLQESSRPETGRCRDDALERSGGIATCETTSPEVSGSPTNGPHDELLPVCGMTATTTRWAPARLSACAAALQVSGSAVSVPRRESPTTGLRIAAPISAAPIYEVLSGGI